MNAYLYHYKAHVVSIYDGDTITADIDLGFGVILRKQKIRLAYIDTPEIRGEERDKGLLARDYLRDLILDKEITLKTLKDKSGKYGRWLGIIYYDQTNVNDLLIAEGHAVLYK
jgi:micrococcal nuclease